MAPMPPGAFIGNFSAAPRGDWLMGWRVAGRRWRRPLWIDPVVRLRSSGWPLTARCRRSKMGWWRKATEFALDKAGKGERRAVVEIAADDLYANRQPLGAAINRHGLLPGSRSALRARPIRSGRYGHLLAVNVELSGELRRLILREGSGRHRRTDHDVDLPKQRLPARPQPAADAALLDPFRMADRQAAQTAGR